MISGLGRSPGEGKGYPLQYSDLENSMDYIVHGVVTVESQPWGCEESETTEQLSLEEVQGFILYYHLQEVFLSH